MENKLQIYRSGIFEIAAKLNEGEPVFDVETVAKSLGFTQIKDSKQYVRWETVNRYLNEFGVSQHLGKGDLIPESAVYMLAFKASNEIAIVFQKWLATEVLPSIRKTGVYKLPTNYSEALRELAATVEEKEKLEEQNKIMAPKAEFFDAVAGSKDAIAIGDAAKVLNMGVGPYKLFQFLRSKKVLKQDNIPYQEFIDRGYFRTIEQKYTTPKGETKINIKTLVYQRGLDYIKKLIEKERAN